MNHITNNLRPHQVQAVNTTMDALTCGKKKVLLELDTGTGKTAIIVELVERLLKIGVIHKVLILTNTRMVVDLVATTFNNRTSYIAEKGLNNTNKNHISIITYSQLRPKATDSSLQNYDLVICDEAQHTRIENIKNSFQNSLSMFVGIISSGLIKKQNLGLFSGVSVAFSYSKASSKNDGYISHAMSPQEYAEIVEGFLVRLLEYHGYDITTGEKVRAGVNIVEPDLIVSYGEKRFIVEVKAYRGRNASRSVIDTALMQILYYKNVIENSDLLKTKQVYEFCLVLFCEVDDLSKRQIFEQYGITIWDIANMQYVCGDNSEFLNELNEISYFPISNIAPEKPYGWAPQRLVKASEEAEPAAYDTVELLEEQLRACRTGKEKLAATKYECICTDIIKYLFDSEFTQVSNQHKTGDDLFRMDLLCGIKGSSTFWDMLIRHYNTRFVVFEYKNYSASLPQNLIYTTEKYLFNAALRNVAFIVSRKGFSKGANIAALGCLKESGKLIIELTDEDLIQMLRKKIDGEEPSDYLLWKLENLLMSVGK